MCAPLSNEDRSEGEIASPPWVTSTRPALSARTAPTTVARRATPPRSPEPSRRSRSLTWTMVRVAGSAGGAARPVVVARTAAAASAAANRAGAAAARERCRTTVRRRAAVEAAKARQSRCAHRARESAGPRIRFAARADADRRIRSAVRSPARRAARGSPCRPRRDGIRLRRANRRRVPDAAEPLLRPLIPWPAPARRRAGRRRRRGLPRP